MNDLFDSLPPTPGVTAARPVPIYFDGVHLVIGINQPSQDPRHRFAQSIGLKRQWFQNKPRFPHYDIVTERKAILAVTRGAILVSLRDIGRLFIHRNHPRFSKHKLEGFIPAPLCHDPALLPQIARERNDELMVAFAGNKTIGRRGNDHLKRLAPQQRRQQSSPILNQPHRGTVGKD